jgi:hypothetical protein
LTALLVAALPPTHSAYNEGRRLVEQNRRTVPESFRPPLLLSLKAPAPGALLLLRRLTDTLRPVLLCAPNTAVSWRGR